MSRDLAEHDPTMRLVMRREPRRPPHDEIDVFAQDEPSAPEVFPPESPLKETPAAPKTKPAPRAGFKPTIDELFAEYHAAHPEVYDEFVRLARVAKANGHKRIGVKMLAELVRWNFVIDRQFDLEREKTYIFNNSLTSRYSRELMRREPDLADMFMTRKLTSK